jgi:hypothetical protein
VSHFDDCSEKTKKKFLKKTLEMKDFIEEFMKEREPYHTYRLIRTKVNQ